MGADSESRPFPRISPYTYCMVYYYTKRTTLARLLANEGPAIYVVHLNRYFVIPS